MHSHWRTLVLRKQLWEEDITSQTTHIYPIKLMMTDCWKVSFKKLTNKCKQEYSALNENLHIHSLCNYQFMYTCNSKRNGAIHCKSYFLDNICYPLIQMTNTTQCCIKITTSYTQHIIWDSYLIIRNCWVNWLGLHSCPEEDWWIWWGRPKSDCHQ